MSASPFAHIRANVTPDGNYRFPSDKDRIAAQKEARKVLRKLDDRRRGITRQETNAARREAKAAARKPRKRPIGSKAQLPDDQLRQYVADGLTTPQIERLSGVSSRTIRRRCADELGIHPRIERQQPAEHPEITADGMAQLRAGGMSWRGMAKHYGVTYTTIRRHRDRHGLANTTPEGQAA